jgi:hypothetical protein
VNLDALADLSEKRESPVQSGSTWDTVAWPSIRRLRVGLPELLEGGVESTRRQPRQMPHGLVNRHRLTELIHGKTFGSPYAHQSSPLVTSLADLEVF